MEFGIIYNWPKLTCLETQYKKYATKAHALTGLFFWVFMADLDQGYKYNKNVMTAWTLMKLITIVTVSVLQPNTAFYLSMPYCLSSLEPASNQMSRLTYIYVKLYMGSAYIEGNAVYINSIHDNAVQWNHGNNLAIL